MSGGERGSGDHDVKTGRRNLPSWLSSKDKGNRNPMEKHVDVGNLEEEYGHNMSKEAPTSVKSHRDSKEVASDTGSHQFSKLMEGVIFVLSGFINPERSILRSQAIEMGAEYRADWTSDCTLLVCAFPNTPKFRQVEAECGTIVSKEWISECYNSKRLVEIDTYLMHAGKPWRVNSSGHMGAQDQAKSPGKPHGKVENRTKSKSTAHAVPEGRASNTTKTHLSPSKVKEWAVDDLNKTMSWLENQVDKPEPSELESIASEGILTCLEDSITALKENQDIGHATEQWKFVPRVVQELAKLEVTRKGSSSISKEELTEQAITCKHIYQGVFNDLDNSNVKTKKLKKVKVDEEAKGNTADISDDTGYDSNETIEMTEEEIELACRGLASKQSNEGGLG